MTKQIKVQKTTWNDYHNGNVVKRDIEAGRLIRAACGRSRVEVACPFCGSTVVMYRWHAEKRCTSCGAMLAGCMAFKVKEEAHDTPEMADD